MSQTLDLMPVVQGRFISLNGQPLEQLKEQHFPRRMLENAELSWADAPPAGDKVTQGKWWTDGGAAELAIGEGVAQRLHLGVGSAVELEVGGTVRTLKVAAVYRADGQHLGARVPFVLPSGQLKDQAATWYGGAHIDPKQVAAMERALFAAYPTVTVINLADVLERIESVVDQITFVVRFLAGFSIFAGLMILASSIASTRFRRMREAVVLKTLGATRMRIVRTFSVEFSVLGLAGRLGGRGLCQSADAGAAAQAGSGLPHRVARHADCAAGDGGAGHGDGLDCQLPDSRVAAAGSAARGVGKSRELQSPE